MPRRGKLKKVYELENLRLFGAICCLHRTLVRSNDINLAEYGISAVQFHTLVFIHFKGANGERVCQRDVERATGLRPSSVSSMLANLEKDGFITRSASADDARTKFIALSARGEELCEKNRELMDKCDGRIRAALTEGEQVALKSLIDKILASVTD